MTQRKKITAKREFIYWFMTTHNLKWPQVSKLLYFLYNSEIMLSRTVFSKYLNNRPNTLLISAAGSGTFPFICKLNGKFYNDVEQIISILRQYPPDTLFCRLSIPTTPACVFCAQPRRMKTSKKLSYKNKSDRRQFQYSNAKKFNYSRHLTKGNDRSSRIQVLTRAIDAALDNRNKIDFYRYSRELKELLEVKNHIG